MKILKYIILIIFLWNIPSFAKYNFGVSLGSFFSYSSFLLLLLFYLLNKKYTAAMPFVIFIIAFFVVSGLVNIPVEKDYFIDFIKILIIIICGGEVVRNTSIREIYVLLLIGALSIFINTAFFPDGYGRYSGFYLNPNAAGFICIMGFAISFSIPNEKRKLFVQFLFTLFGCLTFSRTFFLLWFVLVIISVFHNKKNLMTMGLGVLILFLLISLSSIFQLNSERFSIVENLFNTGNISAKANDDSRLETWALYYDKIFESPIVGNGYKSFGSDRNRQIEGVRSDYLSEGVHNNYLRILGESGIVPFLIFIGIFIFMFIKSIQSFKTIGFHTLLIVTIMAVHLTNHNFDTLHYITFITIWLYFRLINKNVETIALTDSKCSK